MRLVQIYINEASGGYRIFIDDVEYQCGWFQLTHAVAQAEEIVKAKMLQYTSTAEMFDRDIFNLDKKEGEIFTSPMLLQNS